MKSKALLFLPLASFILIIYGFGGGAKWPGGSPGGYTGSPGDGQDCTACHGGTASQVLGWISSDIPSEGYLPGETYTITLSVSGSGDKGFEVSPQNQQGDLLGTLVDGPDIYLVAGNTAVTQDDNTSANPAIWQFDWIAPEAGTGNVTFYGAFTVNKPVTKLSTYTVQENTSISIDEIVELNARCFPNPATSSIELSYHAPESGRVDIALVSMNGRTIKLIDNNTMPKGDLSFFFDLPTDLAKGIYIIRLQHNMYYSSIKLLVN